MSAFIAEHFIDILFGLISAGALAFCKYLHSQLKNYKKMLEDKEKDNLEEAIEAHIEPIKNEIEQLRKYIRETEILEKTHMDLIIASYRFRLVQLCRAYLKKGFMTSNEYEQLVEFYKVYHGLGGNGQAEEYYNKVVKLPVQQEDS